MSQSVPAVSTEQVSAFVELARHGSLREAARESHVTEQGLRNRLLVLERQLGVELYHKSRGRRLRSPLTPQGEAFLPHARAFLDRARQMGELFGSAGSREVHLAATEYLILYVLIKAVRRFHASNPGVRVRLSTRTESEVEATLLRDPDVDLGVAAPYDSGADLDYIHLFSLDWSLIAPPRHPLLRKPRIKLSDLAQTPLIVFERGSTGRQHVMDAFHAQGLSPLVAMEMTTTEIVVRMVEAGLGVSVVPLMPDRSVTRGRKVGVKSLGDQIPPIHSGVLLRRGDEPSPEAKAFIDSLRGSPV
ncbi:LysR family transcriptional regulator [Zavarzinella formosa]|uniref:LysR family transcriptional regulator n=1 Tax=Zavarzinella formosa TaxID=360055 RepID=UPI0002F780C6|nr:LysR family transcriptional regulator [Zavarzinella formosa]